MLFLGRLSNKAMAQPNGRDFFVLRNFSFFQTFFARAILSYKVNIIACFTRTVFHKLRAHGVESFRTKTLQYFREANHPLRYCQKPFHKLNTLRLTYALYHFVGLMDHRARIQSTVKSLIFQNKISLGENPGQYFSFLRLCKSARYF